jgi:hypothetical protein
MTPDEVMDCTLLQMHVLLMALPTEDGADRLHEWWKWLQMDNRARELAREVKRKYGVF